MANSPMLISLLFPLAFSLSGSPFSSDAMGLPKIVWPGRDAERMSS
jgi:hypothetical protein